jgi:carotenoid cleavage dioxygenase-like enzyme
MYIDEEKMPRFGVLLKNAKIEARTIMWFDLLKNTCFHYANAWEEGDKIVVIGDSISPISLIFYEPQKIEL